MYVCLFSSPTRKSDRAVSTSNRKIGWAFTWLKPKGGKSNRDVALEIHKKPTGQEYAQNQFPGGFAQTWSKKMHTPRSCVFGNLHFPRIARSFLISLKLQNPH